MDLVKLRNLKAKLKYDRELALENRKRKLKEEKEARKKLKHEMQQQKQNNKAARTFENNEENQNIIEKIESCHKVAAVTSTKKTQAIKKAEDDEEPKQKTKSRKLEVIQRMMKSTLQMNPARKKKDNSASLNHQRELTRNRVRKHRENMTDEQREEKRRKDRERYKRKKEQGLVKTINDLSNRSKRKLRQSWRLASRRYRGNIKQQKAAETFINANSPPDSEAEEHPPLLIANVPSPKQIAGRKKKKRDRAHCYRQLKLKEQRIKELEKKNEKFKKRLYRMKTKEKEKKGKILSPLSRVNEMTKGINIPQEVKKRLLLGEALQDQISDSLSSSSGSKEKQTVAKLISGKVLKKYKLVGKAKKIVSYKLHKKYEENMKFTQYERKKRNSCLQKIVRQSVQDFLEQDINSRVCPGKNDYIRRGKIVKQKRLLQDSCNNLHKKFMSEHEGIRISFTTFWRCKPFWIVQPKQKDRNTCACIKHANIGLILERLRHAGVFASNFKSNDLISAVVCDSKNMNCMFRICPNCNFKTYTMPNDKVGCLNKILKFYQWETKIEERNIKGNNKKIRITVKADHIATVKEIISLLNKQLPFFQRHIFTMRHQLTSLQEKKQKLSSREILMQVDFAENYITKYNTEIQSMHFGASKRQISLHTGVYYIRNQNVVDTHCFCSISNNLDHQSHAVWGHLDKVLRDLSTEYPNINSIIFFSDGPSSQYRNRNNCYFFVTKMREYFPKLSSMSWNFSEAGHGKGPMDGVGGSLKRQADNLVLRGRDISCATSFVENLKKSSIKLWEVSEETIEKLKEELPKNVPAIPNIMSIHQLSWGKENETKVFLRKLSCFICSFGEECSHYSSRPPAITYRSGRCILL